MPISEAMRGPWPARMGDGRVGQRLTASRALPFVVVGVLTVAGAAIRVSVASHQGLIGDELSTYWIISQHGLGGVISAVHGSFEITPPLSFMAAWLTTQIDQTPELARAPALVAGAASIPVIYLLGLRTMGRPAALVATALATLSPFMIQHSSEARGYTLMMVLVMGSTLAMLLAVDRGGVRWWVVYAVCSCAAVYTHYTCVFALGAQLLWLLWAHPEARKSAILANLGALVAFTPWTTGVINDLNLRSSHALAGLYPFDGHNVRLYLEHWAIADPYSRVTPLREFPGTLAMVLLALAVVLAVAGLAVRVLGESPQARGSRLDRRLLLVLILLLSTPVGEAIASTVGTHLFGTRNLAASWPAFALSLAALLVAAGPLLRFAAAALAIASFAIGAGKMLTERFQRPDVQAAADFIDHTAAPRDVVIDATGQLSAGPLTPLDTALHRPLRVFRAGRPQERDHPFGWGSSPDRTITLAEAIPKAVAAADKRRIFLVGNTSPFPVDRRNAILLERARPTTSPFPARYRLVATRAYPGIVGLVVSVYADRVYADRTLPQG